MKKLFSSIYHRFVKRGISGFTASSRVLPNFIIFGTVRSGTTSLYYDICEHPSVLPADYDEIGFFDSNYQLGTNWYRSMFPTRKKMDNIKNQTGFAITGEDTPFYIWKNEVPERIFKLLPNVKLIAIFRNPVDRAYSNYNLSIRKKTEKLTFEEAIDDEIQDLEKYSFRKIIDRKRSYLSKGFYEKQINSWYKLFSREQIHILSLEDLHKHPQKTLSKIFRFLEIPEYNVKNLQKQKFYEYPNMKNETRKKLLEFYKPENKNFFQIIQKEFDWNC